MSIARALAILGAGASGFQGGQEQARQRSRQEEDDAFRREQRDRQRTDWSRSDEEYARKQADQAAERAAMAPTEMKPELAPDQQGPQAFQVAGKTIADPAAAEAATSAYNAPQAGMRRAAGAVRDPMRAADLQGRANTVEAGDMQLQQAREAAATAAFDKELVTSVQKSGWKGLADFMSKSKADGAGGQSKFAVKIEGGNATIYPVGPDGTAMGQGMTLPDTEEGKAKATFLLSQKTTPAQKLEHFRTDRNDTERRDDKNADNKRADAAEERRGKHEDRMYQATLRQTAAAERAAAAKAAGGPNGEGPVWDDKASAFLRQKFTVTDPATGQTMVDGAGLDFGKALALAQSRRNGGDLDRSIGFAFEADSKLRAAATDPKGQYDPAKHNMLRQMAMRALQAPRAEQPGAGAPAAAPGAAPGGAPAAPPARAVPQPRMQAAAAPGAAPGGDPLQGLSRQQVREKRGQIAAEIKRWEGDPNAKARIDELRTLLERIDNGQY